MIAALLGIFLLTPTARAQEMGNTEDPLEISADQMLEWNRAAQKYIARGNVIAKKGGFEIACDMLTGDYRKTKSSDTDLYKLTGEGKVVISSAGSQAYGDHAVYTVDDGIAVLTGKDLRLVSPDQTVIAQKEMKYDTLKGTMTAVGSPKVIRQDNTLTSDTLTASFAKGTTGKSALSRIEANGNVTITTPDETITGAKGIYDASTHVATLIGKVTIRRGPNTLEGERAEVNMATNLSRMFGGSSTGGRVRGVFFPGSGKAQPAEKTQ